MCHQGCQTVCGPIFIWHGTPYSQPRTTAISFFILFFIQSLVSHKVLVNIFTNLWQVTVSFVMSLSLCLHGTTRLPLDGFSWNILKINKENASFIKIWEEWWGLFTWRPVCILSYLTELFLEWDVSNKVVEKIETHFMFEFFFFLENLAVDEMMWKNTVQLDMPLVKMLGEKSTNAFSF